MTTCLGKSCSFGLPWVSFVNCCQFMYLVISLLVLRAGCGIWLYQFLIIAYLFTFHKAEHRLSWCKGCEWCCIFQYLSWTDSIKPSLPFSNFVGSLYFRRNPLIGLFIRQAFSWCGSFLVYVFSSISMSRTFSNWNSERSSRHYWNADDCDKI